MDSVEIENILQEYTSVVDRLSKALIGLDEDTVLTKNKKEDLYERFYELFPSNFISQKMMPHVRLGDLGSSYESSICHLIRFKKQLKSMGLVLSPGQNDKLKDREFAEVLGVPVPEVYSSSVKFDELRPRPEAIIKPEHGSSSRGVFYIQKDSTVLSIKTKSIYHSLVEAMAEEVNNYNAKSWIMEEAAVYRDELAPDLKCFFFYGKPVLILEIKRLSSKKQQRCWYDPNGNVILGVGSKKDRFEYFQGDGFPSEVISYGKKISENTPVPFLRVDFFKGEDKVLLGEITPHPGWHAMDRSLTWDRVLGMEFDRSWARLYKDLLEGKSFDAYKNVYF